MGDAELQKIIIDRFGREIINEKRATLCKNCVDYRKPCWLLPLTSTGEDCPYFKSKKSTGVVTADSSSGQTDI